jgi:dihydroorotase
METVMLNSITIRRLYDMHCHFRLPPVLESVLPFTAQYSAYGLAMPNTRPQAILRGANVVWYWRLIEEVLQHYDLSFKPLMTIEIRDDTTASMVVEAHNVGAVAGKVYPRGVTTNSDAGLVDFFAPQISETFRAMEDIGMILLLHGEHDQDRILVTKREQAFLPTLFKLAQKYPRLKIVLEHVSTEEAINAVSALGDNVAATITAHHLCLTLNDVIGSGVNPHNACMPMPKDFNDRDLLIETAVSGNPKFFLGSDTAPHERAKKECAKGACGVYSAPVLPQVLVEIFEDAGALDKLEDFTSTFAALFYELPVTNETITLVRDPWIVPEECGGVVPFKAGEFLQWQLA